VTRIPESFVPDTWGDSNSRAPEIDQPEILTFSCVIVRPFELGAAVEVRLSGNFTTDRANIPPPVLFHLLIYQIADGTMALSFAHFDEPGGNQMAYYGCAKLMVRKSNGNWTEIEGPEGLQGKGWAVKQGPKNSIDALRLETFSKGAEATNMNAGSGQ
jgi:hypothetical protein